ncbi:glycosyltransferase [Liquorilactobacillus sucicola DSM 21376 = JCM 15457]|uniref:Glycosyltransferase n=2 Tax=Liquorilactobacillus sucicola TaxID=519050 RepID=A0A023CXL9_9LACO|nr:glycosyltransferase [Liquorilactobacillus sucicola DSM 21376 = JCM 15457]GAJ26260.1 glycosyltransferase [Liquorilactobacillus sucicola DSM 21376 = JCM 15457]
MAVESGNYSILLSVYEKEQPAFFLKALESVLEQSVLPRQLVLVEDGLLPKELDTVIMSFSTRAAFEVTLVKLDRIYDLGTALNIGLKHCRYDFVARIDSDDINLPNRMEKQLDFLKENQTVAVVGTYIQEFYELNGNIKKLKIRKVPLTPTETARFSKKRNPMNHMSVMFRKESIVNSGGYKKMLHFEDYFLWLRVLDKGYQLANLAEVMVLARTGDKFYAKRTGWKYFCEEVSFQKTVLAHNFVSLQQFFMNVMTRGIVRLLPAGMIRLVYKLIRN